MIDQWVSAATALEPYQKTTAGRIFEETAAEHPGMSGVTIPRRGRNAFTLRVAMAELAERTLDLRMPGEPLR